MPTKDVNKLLKGVNDCILAAVDDAGAASPAQCGDTFPLMSCGFLDENAIQSESKKLTQKVHGGELVQLGEVATVNVTSLSGAGTGITAAKKFKNAQCNIYGFGSQQSHKLARFLMNVETPHDLKKGGKSVIQFSTEKKISPDETLGTLGSSATAFAADAAARYRDFVNNIRQENLVFAFLPYLGNFGQSTKAYDASDSRALGSLLNGPTWGAAPDAVNSKLTFDGVNDYADFGDIVDAGTDTIGLEIWLRVLSADGTTVWVLSKKDVGALLNIGFDIFRNSSNKLAIEIGNGAAGTQGASTASVLQNAWTHCYAILDRVANTFTLYINGVASGTGALVTGTISNAVSLYLARANSQYGNVELGAVRMYNFGAVAAPSNIATIAAAHYASEKAIFGL